MKNNCDYFQFLSSNFLGKNKCKKLEYEKEFSRDKNDFLNIFSYGVKNTSAKIIILKIGYVQKFTFCPFQKVKGMQKITSFFILGLLKK